MEALSVDEVPAGPQWQYEPKWDGFRCLVFRDGNSIELQSKSGKPLTRYFPDVVEAVKALGAKRFVLDGEIVVPEGKVFSFDALLQRIHPAASRIKKLSEETPALLIVFDLLADGGGVLVDDVLPVRRKRLEAFAKKYFSKSVRLSPATTKLAEARKWLTQVGATLDGIIAKRRDVPYSPATATACRRSRTTARPTAWSAASATTRASRWSARCCSGSTTATGKLNHVGFTSNIPREDKPALTKKLEKLIGPPGFTGAAPGGPSRWSTARSAEWQPLKPKLVVEVSYDHFSGDRFRHGTSLMRWRPDKSPKQCTMDQVAQKKADLMKLLK